MTTVFRSLALAVLLATVGMGTAHAGPEAEAGYYANQRVVYHNGGDPDRSRLLQAPARQPAEPRRRRGQGSR